MTTDPNIVDKVYIFCLCVGIRYWNPTILLIPIKPRIGEVTNKIFIEGINSSPKNQGIKFVAIPMIPNIIGQEIANVYCNDFFV